MTIVGDPAQRSAPGRQAVERRTVATCPGQIQADRTHHQLPHSQAIMDTASLALRLSGTQDTTPKSVRPGRWPVEVVELDDPMRTLVATWLAKPTSLNSGRSASSRGLMI